MAVGMQEIRGKIYVLVTDIISGLKIIQIKLSNNYRNNILPKKHAKILTGG